MTAGPGIWGWTGDIGRSGFTVTLSLGRTPDEVLSSYGVDPGEAETLTRDEAWGRLPLGGGAQLRAGLLGRWGFCFEEGSAVGIRTETLRRLSADTEAIAFLMSGGTGSFVYIKDGEGVEAFQPAAPETLRGAAPHTFWTATQKVMERMGRSGPVVPAHAVLQTIAIHVRAALDRAVLEGPLLTGFRADPTEDDASGGPPAPPTAYAGRPAGPTESAGPTGPPSAPYVDGGPVGYPPGSPTPPRGGEVRPSWPTPSDWPPSATASTPPRGTSPTFSRSYGAIATSPSGIRLVPTWSPS